MTLVEDRAVNQSFDNIYRHSEAGSVLQSVSISSYWTVNTSVMCRRLAASINIRVLSKGS